MSKSKLATPLAKATSSFMKQIRLKDRNMTRLITLMSWRTKIFFQYRNFVKYLIDNNRVTKEELAEFFPKIEKPNIEKIKVLK